MDTAVYELQSFLRSISRIDKDIPSLVPDGIYGPETTESVIAFQRKNLLPQTGKTDFDTWSKLVEEKEKADFILSPPLSVAPARNEDFPLKKGKKSHLNGNVNLMLNHLSNFYKNFEGASLSSDYTQKTEELIEKFQEIAEISITGETDKNTWNLLSLLYLLLT